MTRPPRDLKKDRLLSRALMFYSYILVGLLESAAGLIAYILVFRHYDMQLTDISFTNQDNWTFGNENAFVHKGRIYTALEQERILKELNAALFFNIVLCQFWHIWFVRARIESFFDRSPLRNPSMNYGVLLSVSYPHPCAPLIPTLTMTLCWRGVTAGNHGDCDLGAWLQ
jgi:magnesium-transporting ATPase (P-type)